MCMRALFSVAMVLLLTTAAYADTTFTYQGTLNNNGVATNGSHDMDFALWDALIEGEQIGATINFSNVSVADGTFTVELDYGAIAFDHSERWLEIVVNSTTLSPRQRITRTPYSIQTRGIFVDENNNVGIGTSTPSFPLHVVGDGGFETIFGEATAASGITFGGRFLSGSTGGRGVYGEASATSGITYGGRFESRSTKGYGVWAGASALTGTTYGGRFVSWSTSGQGVSGLAIANTGITYGGRFESFSPSGHGVYGMASAKSGITYGGKFESGSTDGSGVYGEATALSGFTNGGTFRSDSTSGSGVYGFAFAPSGTTHGGRFTSRSTGGRGVYGEASATSGVTYGGIFRNISTSGRGVYGEAIASSGVTYGGIFLSSSSSGNGVWGEATAASGITYGGRFQSRSTSGHGVRGEAIATSGITYGGRFESDSTSGRGVFGLAKANSGINYGVVGHSNSSDGYDFWASGAGTNYGSNSSRRWKSNVVPINDPLSKLALMRGVYFDWDDEHGGAHDVGMIAEEVGAVMPEIVQYEENGVDAMGMDYSMLTPLLVQAVNALQVKNDALRNEVTAGKAHSRALEERLEGIEAMLKLRGSDPH